MAWPTSNFPTALDTITDKVDTTDDVAAADINGAYDCIEHLEAKVGIDSSGVTTSLDYLLKSTSSSNPGHKHTLANGATDVTASAATINAALSNFTAGDVIQYVDLVTRLYENAPTSYEQIYEFVVPRSGTIRFTWTYSTDNASYPVKARIYRNGVAVGTEKTSTSTSAVDVSDDVSGWTAGDLAQLWIMGAVGATISISNFRIKAAQNPLDFVRTY